MRRLVLLLVALLVVAAAGWWYGEWRLSAPFKGYEGEEQFVEIAPGDGPATIGRKLVEAGVSATRGRSGRRCGAPGRRAG
jgi:cell division protein YceG involved in septum cleavage